MRYLKVTAQDLSGNGQADSVLLRFYEKVCGQPDNLKFKAAALDMTGDGRVDLRFGDVTGDGSENYLDEILIKFFADAFLKLNWFNRGKSWHRYVTLRVKTFHEDGNPELVSLNFHQGSAVPINQTLVYRAAVGEMVDMKVTKVIRADVDTNRDGLIDEKDQELSRLLAFTFLNFKWYCSPLPL
ncbi:hypothetical protein [Pseudomonas sp. FEN]|uniref:hypothetical protein n=1 Tax=Pseudomonas sp. FEN TaxID=2767468 RepID=UPI00174C1F9C|nr:hypothetical protein [Pseudomonas sp. FEN]